MYQQIAAQELFLRGFQLDGQFRMTGWPFRRTGWPFRRTGLPFGHPANMLGVALANGAPEMYFRVGWSAVESACWYI